MRPNTYQLAVFGEALVDDFGASQVVGGAPFNVARHLAALGAAPLMLTRIGSDRDGKAVRAEFERFGMGQDGLQVDLVWPTGRVLVEQDQGGHRFVILPDQAYDHIDAQALGAALRGVGPGMVYYGTLAQRGQASQAALGRLLGASGAPRYLDLNLRAGQVSPERALASMREADFLKLNDEELQWVLARALPGSQPWAPESAEAACAGLVAAFGLRGLIVTHGADGSSWFGADGARIRAGAQLPGEVVDTVGAGDAFSAVFLLGHLHRWPLALTLERANAFAAAICCIRGAVPADLDFYAPWRARWMAG